jgi:hypothetical protein
MIPSTDPAAYLATEYRRVMRSLYSKEFEGRADFYQNRGHSTDTQITANYAVWNALSVLRASRADLRIDRVLIVGPGLDFAPRTALDDRFRPQSYQPFAVADALVSLGLSPAPSIHCIDINRRVIEFFREFPLRRPPELRISSPPGDAGYVGWFQRLGAAIGAVRATGPLEKTIHVRKSIGLATTAESLNIITGRLDKEYDLVIATNVLVYFNDPELLLATVNITSMLTPGGYLISNELRPELDQFANAVGLAPVQARTMRLASGEKAPLYDGFSIYQKPSD